MRQGKQAAVENVGGESDPMCTMFLFSALLSVGADQVLPTKGKLY